MEMLKEQEGDTCRIHMSGQFTFSDHEAFRTVLRQVSEEDLGKITLNLRKVDFIDSAGLGMLLMAQDEAERYGKKLSLSGISGQVKKVFDMARFENIFTIT